MNILNIRIPFFKGKTLCVLVELKPNYEQLILATLNQRYQSCINEKYRLNVIGAIKFHRTLYSSSLTEAKNYVDELIVKHGLEREVNSWEDPFIKLEKKYKDYKNETN